MHLFFFQHQAPNDSLDFHLKSVYDHHKDYFLGKNQILYQKETVTADHRWVFVNLGLWPGTVQLHCVIVASQESNSTVLIILNVNLQEGGKLKAGHAGKGTRDRYQSVGRSTEALHLQH